MEPTGKAREALAHDATVPAQAEGKPAVSAGAATPGHLRLLNWNEVVCRGDFVADEHDGFELWEGPGGFRADAFVKPIYRRAEGRSTATKK